MFDDSNLTFTVETNEDDTEVALVVRSLSGVKIRPEEFVVLLEQYLADVSQAEAYRIRTAAQTH